MTQVLADADTVVDARTGDILCRRCWARMRMPSRVSIDSFVGSVDTFNQAHAGCVSQDRWPYSISTDGESYRQAAGCYTADDAARAAFLIHADRERLWVARNIHKHPAAFVNPYRIVDLVRDDAGDWGGAAGGAWLDGLEENADVMGGLRRLVGDYFASHRPLRFFQVEDAREVSRHDVLNPS